MRRLFTFLLLTGLVVAGVVWLADRPGEVTIHWQGWRVDTTVPMLLAALVTLLLAFAAVGRLGWLLVGAPGRFFDARRASRMRKGYLALSDGLAAVAAGDGRNAHRLAHRADKLLGDPALTGLLTAQAARLSGDADEQRNRFDAMTARPETAFLGHHGLMELALKQGDRVGARAAAGRAFALQPAAAGLAATLADLQIEAGLWAEAELTLATARRHDCLPAPDLARRRAVVLHARALDADKAGPGSDALGLAQDALAIDPGFVPAAILAARLHRRAGKPRKATALILDSFRRAPHPDLVAEWAALGEGEPALDRVKRMQKLIEANPAAADGHVALAEAALEARLWGQARTHLDRAMTERPSRHALDLLARLERDERKDEAAALAWLAKATTLGPEPAWTCGACGRAAAAHSLACPACGAVGRLEWR